MSTKWEYSWFTTGTHHDVNAVLGWAMERANHFGADGWELINFQLRENGDQNLHHGHDEAALFVGLG